METTYTLTTSMNENQGYLGILVKNSPDHFEPSTGLTVAHDILEHISNHLDPYADEFMALGAMVAIRVENGYRYLDMEVLEYGVYSLVRSMFYLEESLTEPDTLPVDHDLWAQVLDFSEKGINNFLEEEEGEVDFPDNFAEYITAWIIKGYENCLRHYGGQDLYGIRYLFNSIAVQCDKWLGTSEEGYEATLTLDFESSTAILEEVWEFEGEEEDC